MATKSIGELTQDEFLRILGPDQGSSRDGSRVAVSRSTRDSCVNVVDGKLQVNGSDEFRRTVEAAYEAKKTPSSGFGPAPYRPEPKPEPEQTLSKLMPKTDTTSATKFHLPVQIYKSPRDPGKSASGGIADDMTYGDMTAQQIEKIPTVWNLFNLEGMKGLATASPENFFQNFRNMAVTLFSAGELKMNTLAMISKFQKNEGGEYRNPVLTRNVRAHETTIAFANTIITEVKKELKVKDGNVNALVLDDLMKNYKKSDAKFRLPRFNNKMDIVTGLTIAINDTWAGKAEITKYEKFGDFYKGVIKVTLYDHFGLDLPDVGPDPTTGEIKPYGALAGFRSWFILQHLDRFAYKPFITVIEMDYSFSGALK